MDLFRRNLCCLWYTFIYGIVCDTNNHYNIASTEVIVMYLQIMTNNPKMDSIQKAYPDCRVVVHILSRFPTYSKYYVDYANNKTRTWELLKHDERPQRLITEV
jgi:hypothetical protein